MNPEVEIKITLGGGTGAETMEVGGIAHLPVPDAAMAGHSAVSAGIGDVAPSPADDLGAGALGAAAPPSPQMEGSLSGSGTGVALPEPVPLDEIERLGSSAQSLSGSNSAPSPEGDGQ